MSRYVHPHGQTLFICDDCRREFESEKCTALFSAKLDNDRWHELNDWCEKQRETDPRQQKPVQFAHKGHSELVEMLASITPLPWEDGDNLCLYGTRKAEGSPVVRVVDFTPADGDNIPDEEVESNLKYAAHCCRLFPKLVKAAEAFRDATMATVRAEAPAVDLPAELWNNLHDVIAEAHGQVSIQEGK